MTFEHLAVLFLRWGLAVKPEHYDGFRGYLLEMMRRERVMTIWNGDEIEAVVTFFITNDYDKLYRKSDWHIPDDEPDGYQIYVDKMICKKWTVSIRKALQETIESRFPNVTEGYYHRAPIDRCIKIYRRGAKCQANTL